MIGGRVTVHGWKKNGFNSVAALATLLEDTPHPAGGSWLSRTTIWCMSDSQRNPMLNSSLGRDHYITNSALLLGGGLPGGWSLVGPLIQDEVSES